MGDINLANKRVYSFPVENPISGDDIPRLRVVADFRYDVTSDDTATFDLSTVTSASFDVQRMRDR